MTQREIKEPRPPELLPPLLPYSHTDLDYYALQQPPSTTHWFGTNEVGQDVLSLTIAGTRISLISGLAVVILGSTVGILVGALAGFLGAWVDEVLSAPPATGDVAEAQDGRAGVEHESLAERGSDARRSGNAL
mgnify:CR=1 FL=1